MARRTPTSPPDQEQLFAALERHAPKAAKVAKAKAKQHESAENKTYTLKEAASLLQISEGVLRLTIRCGKIPATRRGRGLVVRRADLMPFIDPLYDTRRAA
jgi:excisionase family DNA binding protein